MSEKGTKLKIPRVRVECIELFHPHIQPIGFLTTVCAITKQNHVISINYLPGPSGESCGGEAEPSRLLFDDFPDDLISLASVYLSMVPG